MGLLFSFPFDNEEDKILNGNQKNYDYYFSNNRNTHISRKHYRDYQRGYCYGYWYNPQEYEI